MITASYDILKKHEDGSYIWIAAENQLDQAKTRLQELCTMTPGDYFVFDQKSQRMVVSCSAEAGLQELES